VIARSAHAPSGPAAPAAPEVRGVLQRCGPVPCNCEDDGGVLRRAAVVPQGHRLNGVPPAVHDVLRSPGRPLASDTQAFFGARLGRDFSRVRVHTGAAESASAEAVDARAYTVGPHIVFANGAYAPDTPAGRHVVQQGSGRSPVEAPSTISAPSDPLERSADDVAREILSTSGVPTPEVSHRRDRGHPADATVLHRQKGPAKPPAKPQPERAKPCTEAQDELIKQGLTEGASLADRAVTVLGRITYPGRQKAIRNHFGEVSDGQVDAIRARFARIRDSLPNKKVVCLDHCIPSKRHRIECARGQIGENLIQICPAYGAAGGVCAVGVTMLHEAAHNDGARGDVDTGDGYPPRKNPEDNTYSYENFAAEVAKGVPEPELRPHKPVEIQVPE
jgi:hypothetical protein